MALLLASNGHSNEGTYDSNFQRRTERRLRFYRKGLAVRWKEEAKNTQSKEASGFDTLSEYWTDCKTDGRSGAKPCLGDT
jgi:hypothetical protein